VNEAAVKPVWTWGQIRQEPYRLFFPLGIAWAMIGLGVWIPYYFLPQYFQYPGQSHTVLQIQGFLFCFIFGFLCTLLPKILGIKPLGPVQFSIFPIGLTFMALTSLFQVPAAAQAVHLMLLLNFFLFILIRWKTRQGNPPPQFIFIALAMATDMTGTIFHLLALLGWATSPMARAGNLLQFQAFPFLLILGVGGFLLPKLMGNMVMDPKAMLKANGDSPLTLAIPGVVFILSYVVEAWWEFPSGLRAGASMRALIWGWFIFGRLRLHNIPRGLPAYLAGARLSLYAIGLGFVMPLVMPRYALAWEHLIFITGLLWLTLSIAARVLTAHGGRIELLEKFRKQTQAYGILVLLAAISRITTDIWTGGHWLHLAIASLLGLTALAVWSGMYFPLLLVFPAPAPKR